MKKGLSLILVLVIVVISCMSLVGCAKTNPYDFLKSFDEADTYSFTQYVENIKILEVKSTRTSKYLYMMSAFTKYAIKNGSKFDNYTEMHGEYTYLEDDTVNFQKNIDKLKAEVIKKYQSNYEIGEIKDEVIKDLFKKKSGKWYVLVDGNIDETQGYIIMKSGKMQIFNKDDKMEYEVSLSAKIKIPDEALKTKE